VFAALLLLCCIGQQPPTTIGHCIGSRNLVTCMLPPLQPRGEEIASDMAFTMSLSFSLSEGVLLDRLPTTANTVTCRPQTQDGDMVRERRSESYSEDASTTWTPKPMMQNWEWRTWTHFDGAPRGQQPPGSDDDTCVDFTPYFCQPDRLRYLTMHLLTGLLGRLHACL
jgi:hypothetical protein